MFLHIPGFGSCLRHSLLCGFSLPPPLPTQVLPEGHVSWEAHWKFACRPFHAQERSRAHVLWDGSSVAPLSPAHGLFRQQPSQRGPSPGQGCCGFRLCLKSLWLSSPGCEMGWWATFWGRNNTVGTQEEPLPHVSVDCLHLLHLGGSSPSWFWHPHIFSLPCSGILVIMWSFTSPSCRQCV